MSDKEPVAVVEEEEAKEKEEEDDSYLAFADFESIDDELLTLAERHGMLNESTSEPSKRWKHTLEHRHAALEFTPFRNEPTDGKETVRSLFYRFARSVCGVGRVPRKELFETWAMAMYVIQGFPEAERIADLACGHGLLSWALLVMSDHQRQLREGDDDLGDKADPASTGSHKQLPLTVVCVDRQRPKAVDLIRAAMLEEWPGLRDRWDFCRGPVEAVVAHPTTLLTGIHACATLSDTILHTAVAGGSPLALVPCCHSKRSLGVDQQVQLGFRDPYEKKKKKKKSPPANEKAHKIKTHGKNGKKEDSKAAVTDFFGFLQLADYIDHQRRLQLETAGYRVQEATIPKAFTPKNRILLARPRSPTIATQKVTDPSRTIQDQKSALSQPIQKKNHRQTAPRICIPVANTEAAKAKIRDLSDTRLILTASPPTSLATNGTHEILQSVQTRGTLATHRLPATTPTPAG